MKKKVIFFPNGVTAVFDSKDQVSELQEPWLLLFVEFLKSKGHDPTTFEYTLPNNMKARVIEIEDPDTKEKRYNWDIE